jgi:hypothetical protein
MSRQHRQGLLSPLCHASLQGALPEAWAASSAWDATVKSLVVSASGLTGQVPATWALASLENLDLSRNSLTGGFIRVVGSSLQELDLSSNDLSGSLADVLAISGIGLQVLRLSNNSGITGSLSLMGESRARLHHIIWSCLRLLDRQQPALSLLSIMPHFMLGRTTPQQPETGPPNAQHNMANLLMYAMLLPQLRPVHADGGGGVVASMFALPLMGFEAANCGLTGLLPEVEPANPSCNSLERLDLHGNEFTGSIPTSWTLLEKLSCLQLHNNPALCGDVPDDLPCFDTSGTSLGECRPCSQDFFCSL